MDWVLEVILKLVEKLPEGEKFARVVREFTEKLKKLGPSPLKEVKKIEVNP